MKASLWETCHRTFQVISLTNTREWEIGFSRTWNGMVRFPGREFLTMYLYTLRFQNIYKDGTRQIHARIPKYPFISALGEFRQRICEDVKCGGSTNCRPRATICIISWLTKQFEYRISISTQSSYNCHHDRNPNFPQSLPREAWECIRPDHAETSGEPVELIVLPGDDPGLSQRRKDSGIRFGRGSNYARQ